jgi:hypothetical protein
MVSLKHSQSEVTEVRWAPGDPRLLFSTCNQALGSDATDHQPSDRLVRDSQPPRLPAVVTEAQVWDLSRIGSDEDPLVLLHRDDSTVRRMGLRWTPSS